MSNKEFQLSMYFSTMDRDRDRSTFDGKLEIYSSNLGKCQGLPRLSAQVTVLWSCVLRRRRRGCHLQDRNRLNKLSFEWSWTWVHRHHLEVFGPSTFSKRLVPLSAGQNGAGWFFFFTFSCIQSLHSMQWLLLVIETACYANINCTISHVPSNKHELIIVLCFFYVFTATQLAVFYLYVFIYLFGGVR